MISKDEKGLMPPSIMAFEQGSFAAYTVVKRLPKIIADIVSDLPGSAGRDASWGTLLEAVTTGATIDVAQMNPDTAFWTGELKRVNGRRWSDLSFFDLEFHFYHAINSIAARFAMGLDVFAPQKARSLALAVAAIESNDGGDLSLERALAYSLLGNKADLSHQGSLDRKGPSTMVIDERAELLAMLAEPKERPVHIVADNAGAELVNDLLLILRLIERGWKVTLHVKPWPMFVSDATRADFDNTLLALQSAGRPTLRDGAETLLRAQASEALKVDAAPDWGEPRHLGALSRPLLSRLSKGAAVLLKGDLNYRRAFADLTWPNDTSVDEAFMGPPMKAFALRVLKSEIVVGLPSMKLVELNEQDPDWRTNGAFALAQRIGKGWAA